MNPWVSIVLTWRFRFLVQNEPVIRSADHGSWYSGVMSWSGVTPPVFLLRPLCVVISVLETTSRAGVHCCRVNSWSSDKEDNMTWMRWLSISLILLLFSGCNDNGRGFRSAARSVVRGTGLGDCKTRCAMDGSEISDSCAADPDLNDLQKTICQRAATQAILECQQECGASK